MENYIFPLGLLDYSIQRRYNSWLNSTEWLKNTKRHDCLLNSILFFIIKCTTFFCDNLYYMLKWHSVRNTHIWKDSLLWCAFIPAAHNIHDDKQLGSQRTVSWFTEIKPSVGAKSPWPTRELEATQIGYLQLQQEQFHYTNVLCDSPQETARFPSLTRSKELVFWFDESLYRV